MQKVARVKQARKRRGKGLEKSLKRAMAKKTTNFGFCAIHQIKIFHIFFCLILEKSISLVTK